MISEKRLCITCCDIGDIVGCGFEYVGYACGSESDIGAFVAFAATRYRSKIWSIGFEQYVFQADRWQGLVEM